MLPLIQMPGTVLAFVLSGRQRITEAGVGIKPLFPPAVSLSRNKK